MNKEDGIKKFFIDLVNKFNLGSDSVIIQKDNNEYVISICFKEVDSDDPVVNEFYLKIKYICNELKYSIDFIGETVLFDTMKGITISMNYEQYDSLLSADLFRSILGKSKFNI